MTEDKVFRWHHQLDGHWFEQVPGHGEGDQPWDFFGTNDAEAETPILGHLV